MVDATRSASARAGYTMLECVAGLSLALVFISVLFPPFHHEVGYLRERLEVESARLIVEGELSRSTREAARGELSAGEQELDAGAYPSHEQLSGLLLHRTVRLARGAAGREGLWEVTICATWTSGAADRARMGAARSVELSTWAARGSP